MKNEIYVVSKEPISARYIPSELQGCIPLISKHEVMKRTAKGYRLKVSFAKEKGSMYLEEHYNFFDSYAGALEYIVTEANRIADELEEMKQKAIHLMCEADVELKKEISA